MKNTYKRSNKRNKSSTRKKIKNKTKKIIKKEKKIKNKTIKLKQRGGGPVDFIYWLLEKFLNLIMYGWFPQNRPQNEPQNRPQNRLQDRPQDRPQNRPQNRPQDESQIETSELVEMFPREDIDKWEQLKKGNPNHLGAKFKDALDFFVDKRCKYILSIHGTPQETELSKLFKLYDPNERDVIINFLFDEYTDKKDIEYKVYSDGDPPIIIFYNKEDIKGLVKKMKDGVYNEPILKYITNNYNYKQSEEEKKHHIDKFFDNVTEDKLLKLPFIWGPEINIRDTIDVIVTKILFGTVTHESNPELDCGWGSEKADIPINLS